MKAVLSKILPAPAVNGLRRLKLSLSLVPPYRRLPFSLADLPAPDYRSGWASVSQKESEPFRGTMRKLLSFTASGPVGPNKFWEYPWVLSNLDLAPGLSVLDGGCGRAPVQYALADLGMKVTAIDPFENVGWHGIDRRLARKYGLPIEYRVRGMESLDFPDETFDRVISVSVIEHCRAARAENELRTPQTPADRALQGRMMKEMARVLKKGGVMIITLDLNFPVQGVLLESNVDIRNLINASGLTLLPGNFPEQLYGDPGFDIRALMNRPDLDIQDYTGVRGTSLGLVFRKTAP